MSDETQAPDKHLVEKLAAALDDRGAGWCYSCGDLATGDDVAPIVYRLREQLAEAEAKVARVESLCDAEDQRIRLANERFAARGEIEPKTGRTLRIVGIIGTAEVRAALADPAPQA